MTASSSSDSLDRAIREALGSVAAPALRDAVVTRALAEEGLAGVPDTPAEFAAFVGGPLRRAILGSLGDDLGRPVVMELERLAKAALSCPPQLRRAAPPSPKPRVVSSARAALQSARNAPRRSRTRTPALSPARPVPRSARRPPSVAPQKAKEAAASAEAARAAELRALRTTPGLPRLCGPRVFVSTKRTDRVRALAALMGDEVEVIQCWSVTHLIQALKDSGPATALVVDCSEPAIRPSSVAALSDDFPLLVNTVLYGAGSEALADLKRINELVGHWHACPKTADLRAVAAHCASLIG